MSRSGYTDEGPDSAEKRWAWVRWRGAVKSAIGGKRGQAFLREMLASLDAMPEKRLIAAELEKDGEVCAMGCVGRQRGMDQSNIDPEDYERVAKAFGISEALAREIEYENDDQWDRATPEQRWERMRAWVAAQIASRGGGNG